MIKDVFWHINSNTTQQGTQSIAVQSMCVASGSGSGSSSGSDGWQMGDSEAWSTPDRYQMMVEDALLSFTLSPASSPARQVCLDLNLQGTLLLWTWCGVCRY